MYAKLGSDRYSHDAVAENVYANRLSRALSTSVSMQLHSA